MAFCCYCNDKSKVTSALWRALSGSVQRGHTIRVRTLGLVVENELITEPYRVVGAPQGLACVVSAKEADTRTANPLVSLVLSKALFTPFKTNMPLCTIT
eukprot:5801518-Pleurochrysis_carterae.AAC.1